MQEHNQLLFIQRCLIDRLGFLHDRNNRKLVSKPIESIAVENRIVVY